MADSVAEHRARILGSVAPLPAVSLPIADALGEVTAEDVVAPLAVPRFDNAAMDGYAVRAADVESAPVTLPVAGVVAAGEAWSGPVPDGVALRIMTGAPVPDDTDAVVPFEWTDRGATQVRIERAAVPGRHIRRAGEDVAAGSVAVPAGTCLRPAHLGLLAATGCTEVVVRPRPRVAVLATGAELVPPVVEVRGALATSLETTGPETGLPPVVEVRGPASLETTGLDTGTGLPAGAVPDSNSVTLAAAVRAAGGTPVMVGPAPDDEATFRGLLVKAAEAADLVVTTGGISAGDHDVVKAALAARDGMWFGPVAVKPGKPQGCGTVATADGRAVPLVCVPGTPVAAYTSFLLFAAPAIRVLHSTDPSPSVEPTPLVEPVETHLLAEPVTPSPDRTLVLPGHTDRTGRVAVLRGHAGHSQRLLADADVLLVVPPGDPLAAGEPVDVIRL